MRSATRSVLIGLTVGLWAAPAAAAERLVILPGEIVLSGPRAEHALVVERADGERYLGQVTEGLTITSSDPKVAEVVDGVVRPRGNGRATLSAQAGSQKATATVQVEGFDRPFSWSFRNHVQSVLAKTGCSSGPCHGAQAGKAGFKLSLRGYDPAFDHTILTRQQLGRRVVLDDPARSLILTKPTGAVPHKGGLRFRADSREYQVLVEWIADGAAGPRDDDPRMTRLEILPEASVLQPGATQQLLVRAHFSDGRVEDVTRWAKFTSANETVAQVGENGQVKVMGHGEGAITAWYLSRISVATVTAPYPNQVDPQVFASAPRANFIDELVLDKLASLRLPPSPRSGDEEFIRRVYLDTIGVLPTPDEVRKFLADKAADKRVRKIDELLDRPEFVDYWTYKWSDLLLVNKERLRFGSADNADAGPMWAYYLWIRNRVEANTPWDAVVRELLTATGSTLENGAANFFVLHQDPLDLAETTTVAFLGNNINCARCHNHPLEKWTNDQYYAFANLFSRVRVKTSDNGGMVVFASPSGDLAQPSTGKPQAPAPLDAAPISLTAADDRRVALARWITAPDNPFFARSVSNRIWANFLGVGLVEMVDDLRQSNPASNEQLLSALAAYLVEKKLDLKALMRAILVSETYQRSSQTLPENVADTRFYSRYYPRRLMAEVLLDAMSQVTASPTPFAGYPAGWRSLQLPSATAGSYFLSTFGRPERLVTCECERTSSPTMVQVLHISNGETLNGKLQRKDNVLDQMLAARLPPAEMLDRLYLSALARLPTAGERKQLLAALETAPEAERRQVLEDLLWGIMSSKEFLFNH